MSLKLLSKHIPLERTSLSFKLSETAQMQYNKTVQNSFSKEINDLRDSTWADKGISFNLKNCKRMNPDFRKFIMFQIMETLKKNIINMDIWIDDKPSGDVKDFIKEVKLEIKKFDKSSVRVRVARDKATYNPFLLANWFLGASMVVLGSLPFMKSTEIKTTWISGLNATQLTGLIMVLIALLPYSYKYIKMIKKDKKE